MIERARAASSDPEPGRHPEVIGRYEIEGTLGEGAFGRVYKARDPQMGRDVAIKVPLGYSEEARQRILQEARRAIDLGDHPGIVTVFDVGEVFGEPLLPDGTPYIVFQYVAGGSLADLIERGGVAPRRAAALLGRVAEGIHHAHQAGFVHRDLKPENILLDGEGNPYVADFGIAAAKEHLRREVPGIAGTWAYMAPEQISQARIDGRADIWAVGVILYQLLTGRLPFAHGDLKKLLTQITEASPEPPRQIVKENISHHIEWVCLTCLQKYPDDRFSTASDLAEALGESKVRRTVPASVSVRFGIVSTVVVTLCTLFPYLAFLVTASPLPLLIGPVALLFFWAWTWRHTRRLKGVLVRMQGMAPRNRAPFIKWELGEKLPQTIDPLRWVWKRTQFRRYFGHLTLCFTLCLAGVASWSWTAVHSNDQELARLRKEIDDTQSRLHKVLDKEKQLFGVAAELHGKASLIARYNPETPEIRELTDELKGLVDQFMAQVGRRNPSEADELRIRLAKATLAVASGRFEEALSLTEKDVISERHATEAQIKREVSILWIRGQSFRCLRRWNEAALCYNRISQLKPNDWFDHYLYAICLSDARRLSEAVEAYNTVIALLSRREYRNHLKGGADLDLANSLRKRGNLLNDLGSLGEAISDYTASLNELEILVKAGEADEEVREFSDHEMYGKYTLETWEVDKYGNYTGKKLMPLGVYLVNPVGPDDLCLRLATLLNDRGAALCKIGKPVDALRDHDRAMDILTRLADKEGRALYHFNLAAVRNNRGLAYNRLGKSNEALEDYDKAIDIAARLHEQVGEQEDWSDHALAINLAGSLLNRGGLLHSIGRLDEALKDYDKTIDIRTRLVEQEDLVDIANGLVESLRWRAKLFGNIGNIGKGIGDLERARSLATEPGLKSTLNDEITRLKLGRPEGAFK